MIQRYAFPALLSLFALPLTAQTSYYAVYSPDQDSALLATVDMLTGVETNAMTVTMNGQVMDGCTGMALDPISGQVYVVAKEASNFTLATIDVNTGVLTALTTLSEKFAGITFDNAGTLYGITGDGSNTPETLYSIDPSTGTLSLVAQPGTGSDGEAIAFNSLNGLIYRYGCCQLFQSIDPSNGTVTDIFLSGGTPADFAHAELRAVEINTGVDVCDADHGVQVAHGARSPVRMSDARGFSTIEPNGHGAQRSGPGHRRQAARRAGMGSGRTARIGRWSRPCGLA